MNLPFWICSSGARSAKPWTTSNTSITAADFMRPITIRFDKLQIEGLLIKQSFNVSLSRMFKCFGKLFFILKQFNLFLVYIQIRNHEEKINTRVYVTTQKYIIYNAFDTKWKCQWFGENKMDLLLLSERRN